MRKQWILGHSFSCGLGRGYVSYSRMPREGLSAGLVSYFSPCLQALEHKIEGQMSESVFS